ncbi:unnamed protein product [Cuscuta campestris]|uniref:Uncharacterized protein n=1 Tax=Cuscuta campestris TaxID=132261 RepID=A0A484K2E2_9ASTE|nr:unnamed protein product [Cuscuta campestris]
MGIWGFISSTADSVKRNTPGPVKRACTAFYTYSSLAVGKIGYACGLVVDVRRLNPAQYIPDSETRAKIAVFATRFAKNAAVYTVNEIAKNNPVSKAVASTYKKTIRELECENHKDKKDQRVMKHVSAASTKNHADVEPSELREPEVKDKLRMFLPVRELAACRVFNELIILDILCATHNDHHSTRQDIPRDKAGVVEV